MIALPQRMLSSGEGDSPLFPLIGVLIAVVFAFLSSLGTTLQAASLSNVRSHNEDSINVLLPDTDSEESAEDAHCTGGHEARSSSADVEGGPAIAHGVSEDEISPASHRILTRVPSNAEGITVVPNDTASPPAGPTYHDDIIGCNTTVPPRPSSPTKRKWSREGLRMPQPTPSVPLDLPLDTYGYTRNQPTTQPKHIVRAVRRQTRRQKYLDMFDQYEWYIGFVIYVFSQLFGSMIALSFISPMVLAPLGSFGLIFNIVCSRWLLLTPITRWNVLGTVGIVIGCAIVSYFGSASTPRLDMGDLVELYTRTPFVIFMSLEVAFCVGLLITVIYLESYRLPFMPNTPPVSTPASAIYGHRHNQLYSHTPSDETAPLLSVRSTKSATFSVSISRKIRRWWRRLKLSRLIGNLYGVLGGISASQTLLVGKGGIDSTVSAITSSSEDDGHPHVGFSILLLIFFVASVITQLYSLNRGLHYSLPLEVVPLFYTLFTSFSLANQYVFLGGQYSVIQTVLIVLGMMIIVVGVWVLGWVDKDPSPATPRLYRPFSTDASRHVVKLFASRTLNGRRTHADDVLDDPDLLLREAEVLLANNSVSTLVSARSAQRSLVTRDEGSL
ncbi:hypothetical protein SeMB42_g07703 [Synchytrium endobioticum]|uniref:Magnesium transporter n=1 Tax=Synchytrium endobioticum TaxID=286115 RepID=A0A507BY24_9FUNG|nr:hypothetical protein SeMB42_g07703 [Synchytrium endobioticum]TPX44257.1 hypothetical protein SeLEV6574_g04604 [Synchytrium endobioticum]